MDSMAKQKVTVTIDKHLLEWVDKEVSSLRFHNRSHAFEYAIAQLIESQKKSEKKTRAQETGELDRG